MCPWEEFGVQGEGALEVKRNGADGVVAVVAKQHVPFFMFLVVSVLAEVWQSRGKGLK